MRSIPRATLIFALLFSAATVSIPAPSQAREIPPRAISADAPCQAGQLNGHDGFICRDGALNYFCTEPRTVCWPIIPSGPYHRGAWRAQSRAEQGTLTRATR